MGTVVYLDDDAGVIDIRRGTNRPAPQPTSLIPLDIVNPRPKPGSLLRLGEYVLEHGIEGPGRYHAARDLLALALPKVGQIGGRPLRAEGEEAQEAARRLISSIDESYLAIQGTAGLRQEHGRGGR